jgi:hypothetical protein
MRRSRSTVPITIVAMLSITAKGLAADGYPRALEAAATLEGGPGGGACPAPFSRAFGRRQTKSTRV